MNTFLKTNNLKLVEEIQKGIVRLYKKDIAKYDPEHKLYLEEIFTLIPSELNQKNKRFILKNLNENFKFSRYENSFIWLKEAGVALPVYCAQNRRCRCFFQEPRICLNCSHPMLVCLHLCIWMDCSFEF